MEWPELVALKSVNNIPIENLWKWLLKTFGRSLREYIEDGKSNGLFHPANEMHVYVLKNFIILPPPDLIPLVISSTGCGPRSSKFSWINSNFTGIIIHR